jgi:hypothetical protein
MKAMPRIDAYSFGVIVVDGERITSDVIILPDGALERSWRREQGHRLVPGDITALLDTPLQTLVIGTGASGLMAVSDGVVQECRTRKIEVEAHPTAEAVSVYTGLVETGVRVGACFHLTC